MDMKKLCIAFCIAGFLSAHAAEEAPAKPGFWQRTWGATKRVGKKSVDAVTPRFFRKKEDAPSGAVAWQNLALTMRLEPSPVRLPDTRVIDVTVMVVNKGKEAVRLEFPSSLRMDVIVKNEGGKVVLRWSDDQRIDKEPGIVIINPKERLEYNARISTRDMAAGRPFEIEAYFPTYERLRASRTVVPER
jgi:hypothetical protein